MTSVNRVSPEALQMFGPLLERLDAKEWIPCPLCGERYNRLKPCFYYRGTERVLTHACVECAESATGVVKLMTNIPGAVSVMRWPEPLATWRKETPKEGILTIRCMGMTFQVTHRANSIRVWRPNESFEEAKQYENCFQAFEAVVARISGGEDVDVTSEAPAPVQRSSRRRDFL